MHIAATSLQIAYDLNHNLNLKCSQNLKLNRKQNAHHVLRYEPVFCIFVSYDQSFGLLITSDQKLARAFLLILYGRPDNPCSSLWVGVENPCNSVQDGIGFPSPGITERLIPAHLTMLDEKECYSHLSSGWHGFSSLRWEEYYIPLFLFHDYFIPFPHPKF